MEHRLSGLIPYLISHLSHAAFSGILGPGPGRRNYLINAGKISSKKCMSARKKTKLLTKVADTSIIYLYTPINGSNFAILHVLFRRQLISGHCSMVSENKIQANAFSVVNTQGRRCRVQSPTGSLKRYNLIPKNPPNRVGFTAPYYPGIWSVIKPRQLLLIKHLERVENHSSFLHFYPCCYS